jgi:hypothetical protein
MFWCIAESSAGNGITVMIYCTEDKLRCAQYLKGVHEVGNSGLIYWPRNADDNYRVLCWPRSSDIMSLVSEELAAGFIYFCNNIAFLRSDSILPV